MKLKDTLLAAWNNREGIAEGFYNRYLSMDSDIKAEAQRRKEICESGVCGYYDPTGKPETSAVPSKPACSICYCNIDIKTSCMKCWCALRDIQQEPLWTEVLTDEQDKEIAQKQWESQFNKNK